jgi:purine nucleosidase
MRIWLDTDIGSDVDDALALGYLLKHPDLELVGISTVFGDLSVRGRIATELLRLADVESVPVLTGMAVPLTDRRHGLMFGHEGDGLLADADPVRIQREESGAPQRIEALAAELDRSAPDMVVAIGPMTNLGALAAAGVSLPPLTVMGGRLTKDELPGMSDHVGEWNWHCDPVSVQHVVGGARDTMTVIPADVTFQTRLHRPDIERLATGDPLNRALALLCERWLVAQSDELGVEHPLVALHDPLTVAVLAEPGLCGFADQCIEVDDAGVTTVVDGAANVTAAVTVDAEAANQHVMTTLERTG